MREIKFYMRPIEIKKNDKSSAGDDFYRKFVSLSPSIFATCQKSISRIIMWTTRLFLSLFLPSFLSLNAAGKKGGGREACIRKEGKGECVCVCVCEIQQQQQEFLSLHTPTSKHGIER